MDLDNWLRKTGQVFYQAGKAYARDSGSKWAASIAYYSLLSVFPLLLATAAIAAYFVEPRQAIDQILQVAGNFMPTGSSEVEQVAKEAVDQLGRVGLFAFLGLLWSGSRVFGTITAAINVAVDDGQEYGFLKRTLIQLAMLLSVGLLFGLALAAQPLYYPLIRTAGLLPQEASSLLQALLTALPVLLLATAFFLTYHFVPRKDFNWKASLAGAVLATLLVIAARPVFSYYLGRFGDYNLIYGRLAIIVILILWAWILGQILLFGAQVAAALQDIVIENRQPGD